MTNYSDGRWTPEELAVLQTVFSDVSQIKLMDLVEEARIQLVQQLRSYRDPKRIKAYFLLFSRRMKRTTSSIVSQAPIRNRHAPSIYSEKEETESPRDEMSVEAGVKFSISSRSVPVNAARSRPCLLHCKLGHVLRLDRMESGELEVYLNLIYQALLNHKSKREIGTATVDVLDEIMRLFPEFCVYAETPYILKEFLKKLCRQIDRNGNVGLVDFAFSNC